MDPGDHRRIRALIQRELGITLGEDKSTLITSRLRHLVEKYALSSMDDYVDWLESHRDAAALGELADAISTNHTFFYRESAHFECMAQRVLPEVVERLRARNRFDLRVWCAASSTGQEPYVLAMIIDELLRNEANRWRAGLLATDVSQEALDVARRGEYAADAVSVLPERWVKRYFEPIDEGRMRIVESLRREVTFRRLNLMRPSYPFQSRFGVVFCRNVMIYFSAEIRRAVASRIYDVMSEGGYLFLGLSETLERGATEFRFVGPGIFQKPMRSGSVIAGEE